MHDDTDEQSGSTNRFPDGLDVLTPYPVTDAEAQGDRASWPWVAATIASQCGPDEWTVIIACPRAATLEDGTPAPEGTPDEDTYHPIVFRGSGEIRLPDPDVEELRAIFFDEHGDIR